MDLKAISDRISHAPILVILAFAGTVIPVIAAIANILPVVYAWCVVPVVVFLLTLYLVWPQIEMAVAQSTAKSAESTIDPQFAYNVQISRPPIADPYDEARQWVHRQFISGMSDKVRLDYFVTWAQKQDQHDDLYRNVIQEFKDDREWGGMVAVLEEWVTIGFDAIVSQYSGWRNSGTLNQLYIAAHKLLLKEELKFDNSRGIRFAEMIASIVASRRREGY